MSLIRASNALTGSNVLDDINRHIEIKSSKELLQIAAQTKNSHLMYLCDFNEMMVKFWYRDFYGVVTSAKKYRSLRARRTLEFFQTLLDGISAFHMARDMWGEPEWKIIGDEAVKTMSNLNAHSRWNFENKLLLLQAEQQYVEGNLQQAETLYEAAIKSAKDHRFVNEEGLAHELYAYFCLENEHSEKALMEFSLAQAKYVQWGATKKVTALEGAVQFYRGVLKVKAERANSKWQYEPLNTKVN